MPSRSDLKIDYVELPARNLDAAQAFYEPVFAWEFTDYGPEYRSFSDGKLDGGFYKSEQNATYENGSALIVLYSVNLEATRDKVISHGGEIVKDIFSFPGGRRFHFADPNQNELAVWSDQ